MSDVRFEPEAGEIHFEVVCTACRLSCPACGADEQPVHDSRKRSWQHLHFFQYRAYLHAQVPRVRCGKCGKTSQVAVPWGREGPAPVSSTWGGGFEQPTEPPTATPSDSEEQQAEAREEAAMQEMAEKLEEEMRSNADLAPYKDQVLIDLTSEGLRIMIVDRVNKAMFNVGSTRMLPASHKILRKITQLVSRLPNRISITGHTDVRPFVTPDYGNWELSADRANAARREMIADGLPPSRIARVVGLASSQPFKPGDPMNPLNRRIAIIVLKKDADKTPQPVEKPGSPAAQPASTPAAAGK